MKKFLIFVLTVIMGLTTFSFVACNDNSKQDSSVSLSLYAPDGAPALSVARLLNDKEIIKEISVNIVSANTIASFVTGEDLKADVCILPVNLASKMLGNAQNYQMLGVVTNGNLFLMRKGQGEMITNQNLTSLIGKKVGVINLSNVPGLTFKAILKQNQIPFNTVTDEGIAVNDKVNLVGLSDGTAVVPSSDCDFFVVPEPAATTKQNATQNKLTICGSLQQMYGEGNGYPQAVIVAKKSVINNNKTQIQKLVNSFNENVSWLKNSQTSMEMVVNAVMSGFVDKEMAPTFTAKNLNSTIIENCGIAFTKANDIKQSVLAYLQSINEVSNNAFSTPVDEFFYK